MARIRTVKPEFFRHEGLQDLEIANPGTYPMMVFAGLWCQCDKAGRFEWRPRQLKLDILPFLPFDMEKTLGLLESAGFLRRYESGGKFYGEIPSFQSHQRIGGKEAQDPPKHPDPIREAPVKQQGSNGEALGIAGREGKGREGKGNGENTSARRRASPLPEGFGISDAVREWAKAEGFDGHLEAHLAHFIDYATANRKTYCDWDAAFRNAIRADWGSIRRNGSQKPGVSGVDAWWSSDQGIERKAAEVGLRPKAGESWSSLRDRVKQRLEDARNLQ